ncbi:unnamed protein product [Peronospora farinosa]|uniref:WD repeat-containing protein 76 n=1 Tax=Peronospora farinosa TaxID=134698 RepID=A0AAV0USZ5_9STRA|nr:unnamed protein product [Peronospora farinosa]CAI5738775.1 unnamed protein product [Peronospora farinosa]
MHLVDFNETVSCKKRRCRSSKKKRLRLKKRGSFELKTVQLSEIKCNKDSQIQEYSVISDKKINHNKAQDSNIHDQHQKQKQEQKEQEFTQNCNKIQDLLKYHDEKHEVQSILKQELDIINQEQTHTRIQDGENDNEVKNGDECTGHDQEMTMYERKRCAHILRNQAFLQQVGMTAATIAAREAAEAQREIKKRKLFARRAMKAAELQQQPIRKSRRLGSEKVIFSSHSVELGHPLDILLVKRMRQPYGNKLYVMDASDEEGATFCNELVGDRDKLETHVALNSDDEIDYSLANHDVVKTLPYHITAMAFLPRADRVVVACGDEEGHIALWSPAIDTNISSSVLSRPHGYPVSQLIFPDTSTLISSSIDGTVREFDLGAAKSSSLCDISDETGITSLIGSGSPQFYYASCEDGTLRLVDRRARKAHGTTFALHKKRINSVDQHPSLDFCVATASLDGTVCLWDKRTISSTNCVPLAQLQHKNMMHSAHFSPNDGFWLVTVANDSYIDMYDTSSLIKCRTSDAQLTLPQSIRIPHTTWTGTSTKLRPAWDPKRINRFVIGCVDQPSRLQFFRVGHPYPIHELQTVNYTGFDLVNLYHPHVDVIASGNQNGQVSLWRRNI